MNETLRARLLQSGWREDEVQHALKVVSISKKNKDTHAKRMDGVVYWILVVLIFVMNFGVSVALSPLLLLFDEMFLFLVVGMLGVVFGLVLDVVIRSVEHLKKHHHVSFVVMIPIVALSMMLVAWSFANVYGTRGFDLGVVLIGLVYALSLVVPFFIGRFVLGKGYYGRVH